MLINFLCLTVGMVTGGLIAALLYLNYIKELALDSQVELKHQVTLAYYRGVYVAKNMPLETQNEHKKMLSDLNL